MEYRLYRKEDRDDYIALMKWVFPDDPPWKDPGLSLDLKVDFQPELMFVQNLILINKSILILI